MEVKILNNKEIWNSFLDKSKYISFLQDYEYGSVEENLNKEVLRLGIFIEPQKNEIENQNLKNKKKLVGICQIIGYSGKRKGLVVHHGPVIKNPYFKEGIKNILEFLKNNSYHKKYNFLRINPINIYKQNSFNKNKHQEYLNLKDEIIHKKEEEKRKNPYLAIFEKLGFKIAPTYAVTENFWLKEIKNDDEMIREMSTTCQKMLKDSLKKKFLEIEKTTDIKKIDIFWEIYLDLSKRKKFIPYPLEFIKKEFEIFSKENKALLFLGKAQGKYYSSALVIFSHQVAFYHHSASYPIKEPLNHKLQWEIIQEAKNRGCKIYNLWGIAREEKKEHPWYGLTQFKKSFGGKLINLVPTVDYKFSWKYYLTYFYEKIKRRKL
jgi:hypothetical protein